MVTFPQGAVYGGLITLALYASYEATNKATSYLEKFLYPVYASDEIPGAFVISAEGYEGLSTIQKIATAMIMVVSGALVGALTGSAIIMAAATITKAALPISFAKIAAIFAVVGAITGALRDPSIGFAAPSEKFEPQSGRARFSPYAHVREFTREGQVVGEHDSCTRY